MDGLFQLQVSVAYLTPAPWLQRENKFCRGRAECRRRREQDWDTGVVRELLPRGFETSEWLRGLQGAA